MTYYFYDLETSGVNPREQRIMQFAGQRTDKDLNPIGGVEERLICLTEDILPEPFAIITHGITPQQANSDGITEPEFLKWFHEEVATEGTIIVGFNNVRFDDEFMRFASYRNFHDPYEWHWKDGRGRWDLLDVMRMTRALRPDGIEWPFNPDGKPTLRLEMLTAVNGIEHADAHKADADVIATIEMAKLVRDKQPKLFEYLSGMRDKNAVLRLVDAGQPFVYTSGRYSSAHEKTTVVVSLGHHPEMKGSLLVYDLRVDPTDFDGLSSDKLAERIYLPRDSDLQRLPVKVLAANKCPAVAPLGVLDESAQKNIDIDIEQVKKNLEKLKTTDLIDRVREAFAQKHSRNQPLMVTDIQAVDGQLYDGGFIGDRDKSLMSRVRAEGDSIVDINLDFTDPRLGPLLELYKLRNHRSQLSPEQIETWERYRYTKLMSGTKPAAAAFYESLQKVVEMFSTDKEKSYLLEELNLYVQSILPEAED